MKKSLSLPVFLGAFLAIQLTGQTFDHIGFDSLLSRHVTQGLVNYAALKTNPAVLADYLQSLSTLSEETFNSWTSDEQKAFWINAYNAVTLEGILRNYPIEYGGLVARARFPKSSIRQIRKFWDTGFIQIMGKDITLNEIEHEILRKQFNDPRIHFVLVCASLGCPLLEGCAFFAESLDERLHQASSTFINNPDKVRLDRKAGKLLLSSIFKWYAEDFDTSSETNSAFSDYSKTDRGVLAFVAGYLSAQDRTFLEKYRVKIDYLDYDWSLNETNK